MPREFGLGHCPICGEELPKNLSYGSMCRIPEHRLILDEILEQANYEDEEVDRLLIEKRKELGYTD